MIVWSQFQCPNAIAVERLRQKVRVSACRRHPKITRIYELDEDDRLIQRLGYLPKDAPRQVRTHLASLQRQEEKRRIEGRLSALRIREDSNVERHDA